ncbi:MAG: hypothetical protein O2807_12435 [bacterium]|nr:hypothetical protein [bacterium]
MVIARPVETANGQVLCAAGTKMTESLLDRLERLEISHITVEGHPVDDGKPKQTLEEQLAEVRLRFQGLEENKLMTALRLVVEKHIREIFNRMEEEEAVLAAKAAEKKEQKKPEATAGN